MFVFPLFVLFGREGEGCLFGECLSDVVLVNASFLHLLLVVV